MVPSHLPLDARGGIAGGAEQAGGAREIEKQVPGPARLPDRRKARDHVNKTLAGLADLERIGGKDLKTGAEPAGVAHQHTGSEALVLCLARDFLKECARGGSLGQGHRPVPERRVVESGHRDSESGNFERDNMAIHSNQARGKGLEAMDDG